MIVPKTINYSDVPAGGVIGLADVLYEKSSDTVAFNLADGSQNGNFLGNTQVVYFPNASLALG